MSDLKRGNLPKLYSTFLGEIAAIHPYGAFVRIPGLGRKNGLVHKSQMSSTRVEHPDDVVTMGESVYCKVISIDDEEKIGLSMKLVNQRSGKDLDPNHVQVALDQQRRKTGHVREIKGMHLGAVYDTTCRKCGGKGHLSKDCFHVPGSEKYDLLPDVEFMKEQGDESNDQRKGSKKKSKKKHKKEKKKHKKKHKSSTSDSEDDEPDQKKKSKKRRKNRDSSSSDSSSESDSDSDSEPKQKSRKYSDSHQVSASSRNRRSSEREHSHDRLRKPGIDDARDRRNSGEHRYEDRRNSGEQRYGDRRDGGEQRYGDRRDGGEQRYGDRRDGGDQRYGDRRDGGDQRYGDRNRERPRDNKLGDRWEGDHRDRRQSDEGRRLSGDHGPVRSSYRD